VGGGDWSEDRLIPDLFRAFQAGKPVLIRKPGSIRPWQHVLESLSGYLTLAQKLYGDNGREFAEGWNFGPEDDDARPVSWIVERLAAEWGNGARWEIDESSNPHEANHLKLDISKARSRLGWRPIWTIDETLRRTAYWHRSRFSGADVRDACRKDIIDYSKLLEKTEK
jgi:CDP-glucose 4,6-dehydratase